ASTESARQARGQATYSFASAVCTMSSARCGSPHSRYAARKRCARRPTTYAVKPSSRVPPKRLLPIRIGQQVTELFHLPDAGKPGSVGSSGENSGLLRRGGRRWLGAVRGRELARTLLPRPAGELPLAAAGEPPGALPEAAARAEPRSDPAHPAVPAVVVGGRVDAEAGQATEDDA